MSATGFENPEFVDRAHDRRRDQRHSEMADRVEQQSTKEWLQQELESDTRTVAVMGRDFEFTTVGSDEYADLMDTIPDGKEDLSMRQIPGLFREICDTITEHCVDGTGDYGPLDREDVGRLDPEVVEGVFTDLTTRELSPEKEKQVERFLEE